jgi:hypothetical protein
MPQVCEVENSEDSGCRTCGEEHCPDAAGWEYNKAFCSATSSGCLGPKYKNGTTCQYSCGGQAPGPDGKGGCWCDHICPDVGDCCSDFDRYCIYNHNCPVATQLTQSEIDNGECPEGDLLQHPFGSHYKCSDTSLEVGDYCESDGECGLNATLNNCPARTRDDTRYVEIFKIREKAVSRCIDDGTITCPSGRYVDTERYCVSSDCTNLDTQCCNVPGMCANASYVLCPSHQFWDFDNGVTCSTKRCQIEECCKDKAGCEEAEHVVTCPSHKFFDTLLLCSDDVCDSGDVDECCAVREYCNNTALNCSDEENYFLDLDIQDQCAERCTDAECCVERLSCKYNNVLTCNSSTFIHPDWKCARDECLITDTQCCQPRTNCDETVICSETLFSDPTKLCATDICRQSDNATCCQPKANCISNGLIKCASDFFIDTELYCATDVCVSNDTQCCARKANCDSTVSCGIGEFLDRNVLCATKTCKASDTQCCRPQSNCNDDVNCGEGLYFNKSKYCATDSCTINDTQCCERCHETSDKYPVGGICPGALAPKDGSAQMCEHYDLDTQHRYEVAIANQLWYQCSSWCVYDLYNDGDVAFIWKESEGCYVETIAGGCFKSSDRDYVSEKIMMLCRPPEPRDYCTPIDSQKNCQIVWDLDPVENPVAFNRLIYCHCARPRYWGFRDWSASTAVICNDEGHGLDTRLHLSLLNHAWGHCVNWCIYDVWEPETYIWYWDMDEKCYHQIYNDIDSLHFCSKLWNEANSDEYNIIKSYTNQFCPEKVIEWKLGGRGQSCSKRCGELSSSCDGEITFSVNNKLSDSQVLEYFSKVGVNCSDIVEGDHGIGGGSGYYSNQGKCVLTSSIDGYSYRQYCEVSPMPTYQRICACIIGSPNTPSFY